jgi:ElaB/YqjD/DUF883 family membrane-anchored ribosome-binding protein
LKRYWKGNFYLSRTQELPIEHERFSIDDKQEQGRGCALSQTIPRRYNDPRAELGARLPRPRACPIHPRELTMIAAKLERGRKSLVKDFGDVLAEAESLLKQAAAETGDRASDLRSQVEAKLLAAKSKLSDLQDDAVDRAKAAARVTDDYVRDNPWQVIGAAAAIGFLVGVLISRR